MNRVGKQEFPESRTSRISPLLEHSGLKAHTSCTQLGEAKAGSELTLRELRLGKECWEHVLVVLLWLCPFSTTVPVDGDMVPREGGEPTDCQSQMP